MAAGLVVLVGICLCFAQLLCVSGAEMQPPPPASSIPAAASSQQSSSESCLLSSRLLDDSLGSASPPSRISAEAAEAAAAAAAAAEGASASGATAPAGESGLPQQLALPAPDELKGEGSGSAVQLTLGQRVSLQDELGPLVVNSDGSVARIANWQQMTEGERSSVMRVLGKRNRERLDALKEKVPQPQ